MTSVAPLPLAELCLRLFASVAVGLGLGLQRAHAGKDAGARTHMLVSLGATVMTLVSAYAFAGARGGMDPTRIAAQIVTGIGFIGGGTILKEGATVRGLTTAASLWVTAGLGMAVGAGLYLLAALAVLAALVSLTAFMQLERRVRLPIPNVWELQVTLEGPASLAPILGYAHRSYALVSLTAYSVLGTETLATMIVHTSHAMDDMARLTADLQELGARAVRWSAQSHGDILP